MVDEQQERFAFIEQQLKELQERAWRADRDVERAVSVSVERGIDWVQLKMNNGFLAVNVTLDRIVGLLERGEATWSTKS
jgi:hypothetical protein